MTAIPYRPAIEILLIVENDVGFSKFLLDTAREMGFKGLVTSLGAAALALTREYKPTAITLDIFLTDIEGWRVLERLKNDIRARHILNLRNFNGRGARAGVKLWCPAVHCQADSEQGSAR